jgi:putative ABC transport system permease protein
MAAAHRVYRWLLTLYPARFREEYAAPLEQQFSDEYAEAESARERLCFWGRAVRDLAVSLPREFGREAAHDLRFALRVYRQRSLVTFLALAALALAIGATTGIFSVLDAVLLRSLPFAEPDRLVVVSDAPVNAFDGRSAFREWWSGQAYLGGLSACSAGERNVEVNGAVVRSTVAETTAGFFQLVGRQPVRGRAFAPDDDTPGREGVAVIGHGFWQQQFGGDPRALGKTLRVNGTPLVIVGVAPPGFDFPGRTVVWAPTIFDTDKISKSGMVFRRTLGRMNSSLTLAAARSRFRADVARRNPDFLKRKVGMTPDGTLLTPHPELLPLREELAGPLSQASFVLLGMVAFVLLVACANVAHLLLSRLCAGRRVMA